MLAIGLLAAPAHAGVAEAARFYEDAAKRFERGELDGAIVQLKNSIQQNKHQVAAHLLLAKVYVEKGDIRAAQATYLEALNQGADRSEVAVPLGRTYLELDQPAQAIEAVSGIGGFPRDTQVQALALRGAAYTSLNNQRMAAQAFDEARTIDPNAVVVMLEEVPLLLRTGQLVRARDVAAKAVALEPGNAQVWTMDAVVLREAGDAKGSLAAFDKAIALSPARRIDARLGRTALLLDLGRTADAQQDLAELVKAAPKDLRVLTLKATTARMRGDNAAAKAAFTEAAAVIDTIPPTWLASHEKFAMMAAVVHEGLGDRQKALTLLDGILAKDPNHDAARSLQASIYLEMGDYASARPVIESLRRSFADDPQLLYQQGEVNLGLGRYAQAVTALEAALPRLDTPQVRRALGMAQLKLGLADQGRANLEKVFAGTHDPEAGRALATDYLQRGQAKRALAIGDTLVKQFPDRTWVLDLMGEIKGTTGDRKGARQAFMQALAIEPTFGPALLNLARLDAAEGNIDAARRRLQDMTVKGNEPLVIYELALLEQRAGRPEEALKQFRRAADAGDPHSAAAAIAQLLALRRTDDAVATASQYSQKFPKDVPLHLALAQAQIAKGNLDAARAELKNATLIADYDADLQVRIGRLQLYANNPSGAAYNVQKALQARPNDLQALALNVAVALVGNDAGEADKAYQVLHDRYPHRAETELAGAGIAMARRKYPEAVAAYTRALAIDATTDTALLLGHAHVVSGNPTAAARFYQDWLRKRPADQAVLRALAEAQFQAGQLADAKRSYLAALAVEPGSGRLQNNLANVLLALGEHAAAKSAAEAALKIDSNEPAYMDTLGWALVEMGQAQGGLPYLREARLRSPENPEIRVHLAFALSKVGNREEARQELGAVLKTTPQIGSVPAVARLKGELGL